MKKLITPLPTGKMPLFKDDLTTLQNELFSSILSVIGGVTSNAYVVSGMSATDLGGGNVTISNGFAYIDGDIIKFNGYTGAYPVYIHQTTSILTSKTFFSGSVLNVYEEKQLTASATPPGSGQYLTFNLDVTVDKRPLPQIFNIANKVDIPTIVRTTTSNGTGFSVTYTSGSPLTLGVQSYWYSYFLIGKLCHLSFKFSTNATDGATVNEIYLPLPAGLPNKDTTGQPDNSWYGSGEYESIGGTTSQCGLLISAFKTGAEGQKLFITRADGSDNDIGIGTGDVFTIKGNIVFPVI